VSDPPHTRAIVVEQVLPHSPQRVWQTLTESELISQWLMPNDFKPIVGHRFNFRTQPMGDWDGLVHCEVLEASPFELLRYSWIGGSSGNSAYGSRLNSTVTWTLTAVEGGTRVRMEHTGFGPGNEFAYDAMNGGWGRVLGRIDRLISERP
jgi:uncharacterized protein YndB with AHSA1/START domain